MKLDMRTLLYALSFTLLLSACSTKEVYEPIIVDNDWEHYEDFSTQIVDTSSNIALLEDGDVLFDTQKISLDIPKEDRVISQSGGWIISASIDGNVTLYSQEDTNVTKHLDLKKSIASASIKDNKLAVLFADNEIALYDIDTKAPLFVEKGAKYMATDSRIVNPLFMRGLVLFATLDGRVIFVNMELKKRLRTVIVSSEDKFNNVISLHLVENKLIAATSYTLLSMAKKEVRVKYEIRNIAYDEKMIYIATKQGEIISLTSSLQVESKIKLPFAHFYAMIEDEDKLYILEKEGYMVVVDKKSFDYKVHEVDLDDGFIFVAGKTFYVDDEKILLR